MALGIPGLLPISGPAGSAHYGPPIDKNSYIARFRLQVGSVVVGSVLMPDILGSDATTTTQDNANTSQYGQLIAPSAGLIAGTAPGIVVVVTDLLGGAGADGTDVLACYYGPCNALVIGASGSMSIDTPLIVVGTTFDIVVATGERHFAQGAGALATPTSAAIGAVFLHNNMFPYSYSQAA